MKFKIYDIDIIKKKIDEVVQYNKPIVIFGAGSFGIKAYETFKKYGLQDKIVAFCDNNSQFKEAIYTKKVFSYSEIKKNYQEVLFLICSTWSVEINNQLQSLGEEYIYVWDSAYNIGTFSYNILTNWKEILTEEVKEKINKVEQILADKESVEVLQEILDMRGTGEMLETKNLLFNYEQYFDNRIWHLGSNEIYVDLGAFNGDTILGFCNLVKNSYKKIIAFEPNKDNFRLLNDFIEKHNINAELYNLGSWNEKKTTKFGSSQMGFGILNKGEEIVQLNALDNLFLDVPITFIKMDVEGAEKESLDGACKIIERYKPKLAISVYHKVEDLFEIPLWIKRIVPDYNIYLRRHRNPCYMNEIVCYATISDKEVCHD